MFTDMVFKYPWNVLFIVLSAVTSIFFALAHKKKSRIMLALHMGYKIRFKAFRTIILSLGLGLISFALMWPQISMGYTDITKVGLDMYVLMDISKSMTVPDITPDRLSIAKRIVSELLNNLNGDEIGLIPFSSSSYIQMPLTDDYQLAHMFLDALDTDMISGGGTNLAGAIRLAVDSFDRASKSDKVIIILSDGEDHGGASIETVRSMADPHLKVYTIGIGTEKGGFVPVYNDDGAVIDHIKDKDGNPVVSQINTDTLRQLARYGNGAFFRATLHGSETTSLLAELENLKRDIQEMSGIKNYEPLYQYFLGAGLLLFIIIWFIPEGRTTV